jgi:hypothetical protein
MIEKFTVSRDDRIYEAFPDVALTPSGRLVCVFLECTHHDDRSYTCVMRTASDDRGRTWSPKRPLSEPLRGNPEIDPWWNCPRISALSDGRLVAVCDRGSARSQPGNPHGTQYRENVIWFSTDQGETWDGPHETPVTGIVPDQLVELRHGDHAGRWMVCAQIVGGDRETGRWLERCWLSDDCGATWDGPHTAGDEFCMLLRYEPSLWISYTRDFKTWHGTRCIFDVKLHSWYGMKLGMSCTPIRQDNAWLLFWHGKDDRPPHKYRLGVMWLDLDDPAKIIRVQEEPILEPEMDYETTGGLYPHCCYACGAVETNGRYLVYYGAADRVACVASVAVEDCSIRNQ